MPSHYLSNLSSLNTDQHLGITAICSAHPLVIEATILQAGSGQNPVSIEATCNQVN